MIGLLANPSYAGTYVFGRYQSSRAIAPDGEIETRTRCMPEEEWRVVIHDHPPGNITRDQFLANRQRLAKNRTNGEVLAGPPAKGSASCRACLFAAHADAASPCATPAMADLPCLSMQLEASRGLDRALLLDRIRVAARQRRQRPRG